MSAEYEAMQAKLAAEQKARDDKVLKTMAEASEHLSLCEYARRGEEPFYTQGILVSPFLMDQLRGKPAPTGGTP